jgi:Zn-dependent protease
LLFGGDFNIATLITNAIVLLIAMTIHEFAHNYVGYKMGDPTPRDMGRLTLNPFVHINWLGWLMWVFIGFGILGSAPISENRMRDRRWGYVAAVAAGPLSNLALAIVASIPFWLGMNPFSFSDPRAFLPTLPQFMFAMVSWNILLFLFNLLPIFPLDGWHILRKLVPPNIGYTMEKYQQQVMFAFFVLIFLSFPPIRLNILSYIIGPPYSFLINLLVFRSLG